MSESSIKGREISLGDDFGDVAVEVNGVRVEIRTDGSILAFTNGRVQVHVPANDDGKLTAHAAPKPGDRMPDGTVYAGTSPDTGKAIYAAPKDAPVTMKWRVAMEYAAKLDAHGHDNWRLPTKGELNVIRENRNKGRLKGTFNEGYYWTSTETNNTSAGYQRFFDGDQFSGDKGGLLAVRCVRG